MCCLAQCTHISQAAWRLGWHALHLTQLRLQQHWEPAGWDGISVTSPRAYSSGAGCLCRIVRAASKSCTCGELPPASHIVEDGLAGGLHNHAVHSTQPCLHPHWEAAGGQGADPCKYPGLQQWGRLLRGCRGMFLLHLQRAATRLHLRPRQVAWPLLLGLSLKAPINTPSPGAARTRTTAPTMCTHHPSRCPRRLWPGAA